MKTVEYIPYGHQHINQQDIDAVVKVLQSDWLTQGPMIDQFEQGLITFCQAQQAVACSSATGALHLAMRTLLTPGDIVWTTPITFVATANCAQYCNCAVDFVDIDRRTYNLSVSSLEEKLIAAEKIGKLPKLVVPVHLAGQACDMQAIKKLADQYGFRIIVDASHAIGGRYHQHPIGYCQYADIVVFSFHPVKIMTCGEGGAALTNHSELARKMRELRMHGITRECQYFHHSSDGPWYYEQVDLGYNYRMTDLQAALGLSQLQRVPKFIARRHQIAAYYGHVLADLPLQLPYQDPQQYSAYHLYPILIRHDKINRHDCFVALRKANIGVNVHYIPIYRQPYYQQYHYNPADYPISEDYYQHAISLPIYPNLTEQQQDYVVDHLRSILL